MVNPLQFNLYYFAWCLMVSFDFYFLSFLQTVCGGFMPFAVFIVAASGSRHMTSRWNIKYKLWKLCLHILFIKIRCAWMCDPAMNNNLCSARNIRVKAVKCIWRAKVMGFTLTVMLKSRTHCCADFSYAKGNNVVHRQQYTYIYKSMDGISPGLACIR